MRRARLTAAVSIFTLVLAAQGALAEVVVVVSAKSPVTKLTSSQAADIFLGKTNRLPGGEPAMPIDQAEGSPEREEFYVRLVGKSRPQMKAHWSKIIFTGRGQPPKQASGNGELKKLLAENPGAIGYVDRSAVDRDLRIVLSP